MAGIGFVLRKLVGEDNYFGVVRAFVHSSVVAVGPWILIVLSLGLIIHFTELSVEHLEAQSFLAVIIYNVLFSFLLSAPIYMVAARYVADCLFKKEVFPVPGILLSCVVPLFAISVILAAPFYIFYTKMDPFMTLLSIVNFVFLTQIWFVMLFLSCIRDFRAITLSWVLGSLTAIGLAIYLGKKYDSIGILGGLDIGFCLLLFLLYSNILSEYPYRFFVPNKFPFYFRHYRALFWSGLFLFAGMWIDKFLMWFAPESTLHANNLRTNLTYDGAIFFAYLTIVPIMSLFVFSIETNFHDSYIQYIRNIEKNAAFSAIEREHNTLVSKVVENAVTFLIIQGSCSFVIILLAPELFKWLHLGFLQFSIFRLGTLGAFFNALNLLLMIYFSYFDSMKNMVILSFTMFVTNTLFTLLSILQGFDFYGFGYAFSMVVSFIVGGLLFINLLKNLDYQIFIVNVLRRRKVVGRVGHE